MKILAIESSCDETAAAVVEDGKEVISSVIATQVDEHRLYGGVVPEIASRRHCESICGVVEKALLDANMEFEDVDALAVTYAPGLIGALLVGVNYAKGVSMATNKPLIPVHHLRSHIAANYIAHKDLKPPFLCLVISGGHTHIINVKDYTDFEVIGRTRDDAVGEAFDKAARSMGLPYPGGAIMDKEAKKGDPKAFKLPRPKVEGSEYDFSFSGLKTAVLNEVNRASQKGESVNVQDMAASFGLAVCDILADKVMKAARDTGASKLVLAGGVAANSGVRERFEAQCEKNNLKLYIPPLDLCGDNAAMVGSQGYFEFLSGNVADMSLNATASLPIE